MKTFFRELVLITCLVSGIVFGTQAQSVPGAIKYQAVLRDVNGKTLANKENVNLRISLRLDDPTMGQIAYSEEHMGLATNAYGVINLEIGRGTVTSGKDLHEVPWAQHDIYVQIEIETDGTGYTHMGNAELLTVPYAFYAENTSGDRLYENLDDNVLPKYNAANKTLVNSGVSQKGRELEVDASSITFINKADGSMNGYKFPMTVGRRGQVLGFTDNVGTLDWVNVEGGSGGEFHLNLQGDGHLVYWNDDKGELDTVSALRYDYKGTRKLDLNTDIMGNNNVLVSDKLGDGQIWVGDGFSNRLAPVNMSGAVSMDKTGNTTLNLDGHVVMNADNKTRLNLAMKGGIQLIPGKNGARDTLAVDTTGFGGGGGSSSGGGESLWETRQNTESNYTQLFPKSTASGLGRVYVGIGYDDPKALLHVNGLGSPDDLEVPRALFDDCNVEFSGAFQEVYQDGVPFKYTPSFRWDWEKASLFVGATSNEDDANPDLEIGSYAVAMGLHASASSYSFALGAKASAMPNYTFALGKEASVTDKATDAFAIGNNSSVSKKNAMALGREAKGDGEASVALGYKAVASGANSVVLGSLQEAGSNAVVVGYDNGNDAPIQNAVVVGTNNSGSHEKTIAIGIDNEMIANSIFIGRRINATQMAEGSIVVGSTSTEQTERFLGAIVLGQLLHQGNIGSAVSVGRSNSFGKAPTGGYNRCNMLGTSLTNNGVKNLTMIGNNISNTNASTDLKMDGSPVFVYGSSMAYFGINEDGDSYFYGDVYSSGTSLSSDERLKTDIRPRLWMPALLDSITPVSYIFKSDKKQRTRFGFIAQDVRRVFPELVRGDEEKGMLSLDYIGLVPVLWQINQNLSHQVSDLEKRLEEQSRKQAELESQLQAIKEKLGM